MAKTPKLVTKNVKPKNPLRTRLVGWMVFNVAVSLVPFGFSAIWEFIQIHPNSAIGSNFFSRREFFLIIVSIASENIGDIMVNGKSMHPYGKYVLGGVSLLLLLFSAFLFAVTSSSPGTYSEERLFSLIIYMFTAVLLIGIACKVWIKE